MAEMRILLMFNSGAWSASSRNHKMSLPSIISTLLSARFSMCRFQFGAANR
jgi:hypothetical protein